MERWMIALLTIAGCIIFMFIAEAVRMFFEGKYMSYKEKDKKWPIPKN